MRLDGSNTSIFSARLIANGDTFGYFSIKGCLGKRGSCLTYFRALSLLKNPRSESSGEPNSYLENLRKKKKKKQKTKHKTIRLPEEDMQLFSTVLIRSAHSITKPYSCISHLLN